MLIITIEVDAPSNMAQAVKEHLAMLLEGYGDTRVIKVDDPLNNIQSGVINNG